MDFLTLRCIMAFMVVTEKLITSHGGGYCWTQVLEEMRGNQILNASGETGL